MQIIKTNHLTESQRQEAKTLYETCRAVQPSCPSLPFEDNALFFLLFDPQLVCALALIMPGLSESDEAAECIAMTHPSFRRRGYFTALFDEAEDEIEDTDLLFLTDGTEEGALSTLQSLGADYDFCEYRMERSCSCRPIVPTEKKLRCQIEENRDHKRTFLFYQGFDSEKPVAVCHTIAFSSTRTCLYSFEVVETLRGRGIGTEALAYMIEFLSREGASSLQLHVSGENETAVNLYKKAGFRITETLSYYLY